VFEEVFRKIDTMMDSKTAQDELRQLFKNGQATKEDNENMEGLPINHAEMSGCTACCAIITIDKIFVGNLGDSRAVLAKVPGADSALPADALEAVEMSVDMKPDLESERQRIIAAGGMVLMGRVDGNLSLSAAIGDK
jgi:serine/threonine protein phosphatase PrpC